MLNKKTKIIILILMFLVTCICSTKVEAVTVSQVEYTEEYKEWLALPEDEKYNTVVPKMFEIDVSTSENKIFTKIKSLMSSIVDKKFDLRDTILKNLEIRNQGNTNACWAFATLSSLETNLALQNNSKVYDFSESHMDYSTSQNFHDGEKNNGFSRDVSIGGNFQIGSAYLTNGEGAILEEDMQFISTMEDVSIEDINGKEVVTKVTDTDEFYFTKHIENEQIDSIELNALILKMKEHIKTSGSISAGIHGADLSADCYNNIKGAIYCKNEKDCEMDHNVSIIGWDDEYSKDNFNNKPNRDGAWIIRNSWGEELNGTAIGDNGFMYVSYEDVNIYKQLFGIEKATENVDYDNIYQYNELGYNNAINLSLNKVYIANVFNRDKTANEVLTEVSLNVMQNVKCKVYVNSKNESKAIQDLKEVELVEGKSENFDAGYHTLEFKNPITLTGEKFVVVIEVEAIDDDSIYCATISKTTNNFWDNVEIKEKVNYLTFGEYFEKNMWVDTVIDSNSMNVEPSNLTIKAFTREVEIVETPTPTVAPTPTQKPTQAPTPTLKPTTIPDEEKPTTTVKPTNIPTIKPTSTPINTPTLKPTSPIVTKTPSAKPTATTSDNSGILGSINTNSNSGGSTMTNQSSLPYVGKTEIIVGLIIVLIINMIVVYKKYKKIY